MRIPFASRTIDSDPLQSKPERKAPMKSPVSRREFFERTTAGIAAVTAAGSLKLERMLADAKDLTKSIPKRVLGKTGVKVSQLAFGGGSRFMMYKTEEEALEVLNWVIDNGINY